VGITAPQRVSGAFAEVPTMREQGSDVVMSGWRGVVAPKGVTPAQVAYWEGVFAALGKTDEWKQELEKNFWHGSQLSARESREYLDKQYAEFRQILTELGMAKSAAAAK
jgi:putative tricarboxylic transport membrane protein